jgi:hypothetical protein
MRVLADGDHELITESNRAVAQRDLYALGSGRRVDSVPNRRHLIVGLAGNRATTLHLRVGMQRGARLLMVSRKVSVARCFEEGEVGP